MKWASRKHSGETIEGVLTLALMLLAVHWLCDYPLQGDFLSKAKQNGPLRVYHLIAHVGTKAAALQWSRGISGSG